MLVFVLAFLVTILLCRLQDDTDDKFIQSRESILREGEAIFSRAELVRRSKVMLFNHRRIMLNHVND